MNKSFHLVEDLINQPCTHGSQGYPVNEVIEDIIQVVSQSRENLIWKIQFQSGCFTYLNEAALHNLLDNGESQYRRARANDSSLNDAYEEIIMK